MKKQNVLRLFERGIFGLMMMVAAGALTTAQVRIDAGLIEGTTSADSHVRIFKGIPYAAPPVGDLRWQAPRAVASWTGVRQATEFGARCMQGRIFEDMVFRDEMSEDCLSLNVWTPAKSAKERLPVMVWIYGGGFQAGSASEPRQDGELLAKKGVVVVSFNYRLGVFGFLSHPELTKEAGASGNYGLLDQVAALEWVKRNIAAFGGDPRQVTIFGESAGSFSVSALMASPLAQGLFRRAIGESGAFFTVGEGTLAAKPLARSEEDGVKFVQAMGAKSIADLRAKSADEVLQAALKSQPFRFTPNIDGRMLPRDVYSIYAEGKQAHVPLLAGWNADEARVGIALAKNKPTVNSFSANARKQFGESADTLLKLYPANSDAEALESASALAGDTFIGYTTWKWIEMQSRTGRSTIFRYSFDHAPPVAPDLKLNGVAVTARDIGARHAGEIEYVFGTLSSLRVPLQPEDWKLSDAMMTYWSNFARTGNPNGAGLPRWPNYDRRTNYQVMHLDTALRAAPDAHRDRYEFLDVYNSKQRVTMKR